MPKTSADTLVANVRSGKLKTLGGKFIEAVEVSSGATCYRNVHSNATCHCYGHGPQRMAHGSRDGVERRQTMHGVMQGESRS